MKKNETNLEEQENLERKLSRPDGSARFLINSFSFR